jgi:S-DNA-T family DNA segregation ATPase FtsK/SpoIIIE
VNKLKSKPRVTQLREFIAEEEVVAKEEAVVNTEAEEEVEEETEVAEAEVASSETTMKTMMVSPLLKIQLMIEAEVEEVSTEAEETEVNSEEEVSKEVEAREEEEVSIEVEVKLVQEARELKEVVRTPRLKPLQLKPRPKLKSEAFSSKIDCL